MRESPEVFVLVTLLVAALVASGISACRVERLRHRDGVEVSR